MEDSELKEAAAANSFANFGLLFREKFEERAIEARSQSPEFFERAFGDAEMQRQLGEALARDVYRRLTGEPTKRTSFGDTSLTAAERGAVERFIDLVSDTAGDDLEAIWLYGSKARNEASSPESDVDLLVLARGGREKHRAGVLEAAREAESLDGDGNRVTLSPAVEERVSLARRRKAEDFFIRDVDRDKIVLFEHR